MLKKLTNKKGFTLMEMLIVVAIIAILVAIAIPTFNSSLNKARVATDEANLRAEYAETMVEYLDKLATGKTVTDNTVSESVTMTGNSEASVQIGGLTVEKWEVGDELVVTIDKDGAATIAKKTA